MKLLIYIPTHNRAETLLEQLSVISASKNVGDFTVVVRNNNSDDPKYEEVENLCIQNGFIYRKNVSNIGGNANIVNGFMYCDLAEYLWILSDDDIISKDTIKKVFTALNKYDDIDLLHFTTKNIEGKFHYDQKGFIDIINEGLGLISLVIYRSDFIKQHIRSGYDNIISGFPHLTVQLESVKDSSINVYKLPMQGNIIHGSVTPSDIDGHANAFFGFPLLVNYLEKQHRAKFLLGWLKVHWFRALRDVNSGKLHPAAMVGVMKENIPLFSLVILLCNLLAPIIYIYFKLFDLCDILKLKYIREVERFKRKRAEKKKCTNI